MTKYKIVFEEMVKKNKEVFDSFKIIHDQFVVNPKKWRNQFNEEGEKIQAIIRKYENTLCRHSESGGFGKFSGGLAEKFWEEIRKVFPKIDEVGIQ